MNVFDAIKGQTWAVGYLRRAGAAGRLSQTLIFHGPPYVGKETAAMALASWWLCDRESGCGVCPSCRQVATYQHPDFHYVFPCPASWYEDPVQIGEIVAQRWMPEHRLGEPLTDPNLTISIEAVRGLIRAAARTPFGGRARVIIIRSAERLREEAQNAFLKLLEDAPSHVRIVLLTTNMERMLPTVRSRAYHIRFVALGKDDWISVFRSLHSVDLSTAELLYRLSGASLARAASLLSEDEALRQLPMTLFTQDSSPGAWAFAVMEHMGPRVERDDLDRFLDFTLLWLRDIMVWRGTKNPMLLLNLDAADAIADIATRVDLALILRLISELESLRQASRLNLDPRLVCHRIERLMTRSQLIGGHG
ncbi:hypothetical protein JXA88_01670 [Candidatus Fermentibacteria bacterium]|nr:hypothetical protein [Candidatus Fermentibacteria bacterium]